jgi:hydrogenase expression/formation protein HypC
MCLAIPGKVVAIENCRAEVMIGTNLLRVGLNLVADIHVGDYVLIHAGYVLDKIDEQEALQVQTLLEELQSM